MALAQVPAESGKFALRHLLQGGGNAVAIAAASNTTQPFAASAPKPIAFFPLQSELRAALMAHCFSAVAFLCN